MSVSTVFSQLLNAYMGEQCLPYITAWTAEASKNCKTSKQDNQKPHHCEQQTANMFWTTRNFQVVSPDLIQGSLKYKAVHLSQLWPSKSCCFIVWNTDYLLCPLLDSWTDKANIHGSTLVEWITRHMYRNQSLSLLLGPPFNNSSYERKYNSSF